jgi:hypothetical protein
MRQKLPDLEGKVVVKGQDKVIEGYSFNIHGKFYIDGYDDDSNLQLTNGDKIAIMTIPIGG